MRQDVGCCRAGAVSASAWPRCSERISKLPAAAACAFLVSAAAATADLVYPASLDIEEASPGEMSVTLTLPLFQGRVMKARPILPDTLRIEGDPEVRAGLGSVTRVWRGTMETDALPGSVFGLSGLLGTSSEARFSLTTLDGRRYEDLLKPTDAFFLVPERPTLSTLAKICVRDGLRRATRHLGLWFLAAALTLAGARGRWMLCSLVAIMFGLLTSQFLGEQSPTTRIPMAVSGLAAAAALVWIAVGRESKTGLRHRAPWRRFLRVEMPWVFLGLLTGLLAGWGGGLTVVGTGWSSSEIRWAGSFLLAGWFAGACLLAGIVALGWGILPGRVRAVVALGAGLLAATWFLYQSAGLVRVYGPAWLVGIERAWRGVVHVWFAPFASDWAMAKLRLPWLAVLVVCLGWIAVARATSRTRRMPFAVGTLCLALALLPWGTARIAIPFLAPSAPGGAQARRILEPMLSGIYHAVNLEGEGKAYDRLAQHVTGDMLTDLYIDSRRGLLSGTREGARVAVKEVKVVELGPARGSVNGAGYLYPCTWTVTARVTHWSHTHERINRYEGDVALVVDDDQWRISGMDLRLEEREVVPGSFSG